MLIQQQGTVASVLAYIERGWPVVPLYEPKGNGCSCGHIDCRSPGKHPRTRNGGKDASLQVRQVRQWWETWKTANVGIQTGRSSGLVVIDVDPRHGGHNSWCEFAAAHSLEDTLKVSTGGGGYHLYYLCPSKTVRNAVNVMPGVDVRGEGGYVVAPPSLHVSEIPYEWANKVAIRPLPDALIGLLADVGANAFSGDSKIANGSRNNTLFSLGAYLQRQGVPAESIASTLDAVNKTSCEQPLADSELASIRQSVARYSHLHLVQQADWPEPQPLPDISVNLPTMSPDAFPEALQPWATDICERMQIPLEFVAAPAIVSLSAVIGRRLGVYPKRKDDWLVVPNLWGGLIARPGFFKSPAIAEALKPLEALVKKERIRHEAELLIAKSKEDVLKAKLDGLKECVKKAVRKGNQQELAGLEFQLAEALKELSEISVTERRFKTNDATIEKIGALLVENPDGIMIVRDELAGWLKTLDKSGREGDREFFLEAWNGYGSYTVDRIGRGTLHIPSLCLSIFGGLQPGKLEAYVAQAVSSKGGDDGLLQRFQVLMYPNMPKKWKNVDRHPNKQAQEVVFSLFEKIAGLPGSKDGQTGKLRFAVDAQEAFDDWRCSFEKRLRKDDGETPAFESHLSKYRSLLPSLALIFQVCESLSRGQKIECIELPSLIRAKSWLSLLEAHARKVYAGVIQSDLLCAHALAKRIKAGMVPDGATVRSIYRKHWSSLDTPAQVDKGLTLLEELGWLMVNHVKVNYSTKDEIRLNPKLNFTNS